MIIIGKTANCLLGAYVTAHSAVLKAVDEFVRMRKITRSVKMTYCSRSCQRRFTVLNFKGRDLVALTAIFSNICTAHAQKRLFLNFWCKFRHRRSIPRSRFPNTVQNFSDLATFSVHFCIFMLNVRHISTSGLFDLLT